MKFIGKLLIYLLVALLIVVLAFYFLLQTRWGASQVSSWITVNTDYELNFDLMDHRFSSPSHILLENVTFGRDGKPATLVAKKVDIGLSSRQITDPLHMDAITLFDGTLNLSPQTAPLRQPGHPFNSFILAKTPANRWGTTDDLKGPAVFLASSASDFVNGHVLYVDGGILASIGKQP